METKRPVERKTREAKDSIVLSKRIPGIPSRRGQCCLMIAAGQLHPEVGRHRYQRGGALSHNSGPQESPEGNRLKSALNYGPGHGLKENPTQSYQTGQEEIITNPADVGPDLFRPDPVNTKQPASKKPRLVR